MDPTQETTQDPSQEPMPNIIEINEPFVPPTVERIDTPVVITGGTLTISSQVRLLERQLPDSTWEYIPRKRKKKSAWLKSIRTAVLGSAGCPACVCPESSFTTNNERVQSVFAVPSRKSENRRVFRLLVVS